MDAYWFDYGREIKVAVYEDYFANAGHWEWYQPCDLIFAETRGKARAMFCRKHNLEYIDTMKTRLVAHGVDRPCGFADYGDPLWVEVDPQYFVGW